MNDQYTIIKNVLLGHASIIFPYPGTPLPPLLGDREDCNYSKTRPFFIQYFIEEHNTA